MQWTIFKSEIQNCLMVSQYGMKVLLIPNPNIKDKSRIRAIGRDRGIISNKKMNLNPLKQTIFIPTQPVKEALNYDISSEK